MITALSLESIQTWCGLNYTTQVRNISILPRLLVHWIWCIIALLVVFCQGPLVSSRASSSIQKLSHVCMASCSIGNTEPINKLFYTHRLSTIRCVLKCYMNIGWIHTIKYMYHQEYYWYHIMIIQMWAITFNWISMKNLYGLTLMLGFTV